MRAAQRDRMRGYGDKLLAQLTDAIGELNRTPGTDTDETMAIHLQRIFAERGMRVEMEH